MPNKQRTNVRKSAGVDARTRRTTTGLAHALIQLVLESGRFEDISVRQILQRAGVGMIQTLIGIQAYITRFTVHG